MNYVFFLSLPLLITFPIFGMHVPFSSINNVIVANEQKKTISQQEICYAICEYKAYVSRRFPQRGKWPVQHQQPGSSTN